MIPQIAVTITGIGYLIGATSYLYTGDYRWAICFILWGIGNIILGTLIK